MSMTKSQLLKKQNTKAEKGKDKTKSFAKKNNRFDI